MNGWPTRRLELARTPIRALKLSLREGFYARVVDRVQRELARRGMAWFPEVYLSTGWHCPDRIPIVGVPFALATRELRRLEKEVTGQLETPAEMVRLLRHEVGHATCYAFRLYREARWRQLFGPMSRPYREDYPVSTRSRQFVRHLDRHYAQKHPDEDFAETFAVWLTPKARWRREYSSWGALRKLEYVDRVMSEQRGRRGPLVRGPHVEHVASLELTVGRHYQRLGYRVPDRGFERGAIAFFDEELRAVFGAARRGRSCRADEALRRLRPRIVRHVVSVLGVRPAVAERLYDKYVSRSCELDLRTRAGADARLLVAVSALMASHLLTRKHTGSFTRRQPRAS